MNKIYLENDESTNKLGALISEKLKEIKKSSIEIHLEGDLGAGKTFLTRSIISNSGWNGLVKSPTYTLCEEYDLGDVIFLHIDLYRTDEPEDIHIFDLDRKTHLKKIIIIEWPQKLAVKRNFDLKISFEHFDDGRKVLINDSDKLFSSLIKHYE
ncbi:tRNA (adenosine(37)-N6)-threonylcarbamoyltransferase complex ATPase subunit type 1 TsaE [Gammaproteobacteria bacterium]|jgi:tRNA threonylcarbamoyladenosine biosynthesis protein TsaE|nr:tRNA (adenosine(37)-N6)-threonylcarbamoyltransferase complex ATPase subunit type 1 TsaE [Gammaproteobacteria bacterium]